MRGAEQSSQCFHKLVSFMTPQKCCQQQKVLTSLRFSGTERKETRPKAERGGRKKAKKDMQQPRIWNKFVCSHVKAEKHNPDDVSCDRFLPSAACSSPSFFFLWQPTFIFLVLK